MQLTYQCPNCFRWNKTGLDHSSDQVECSACEWSKEITLPPHSHDNNKSERNLPASASCDHCLICRCPDLWKQKDFPQRLGVLMVGAGALLSTIAWANYWPKTAIGILMIFAFIDLLLYLFMPDVLVCYQCHARHRPDKIAEDHPPFDLEKAERYRQEKIRSAPS